MIDSEVRGAVWDGQALLGAIGAATSALEARKAEINALNVFPVPDGDTGTNMSLTLRSALAEAGKLDRADLAKAGVVADKLALGSLMGARGNSGVILSQILRGFARSIADLDEIDGRDFANGLAEARDMAYRAVVEPVEGTMLTVIRVAADRAATAATTTSDLVSVIAAALEGAREALAETPNLLDILCQAGVVDAGGQGLVTLFEGLERYLRGESVSTASLPTDGVTTTGFFDRVEEIHAAEDFGYCTNFLIVGERIDFERVRAELSAMGTSAVIIGDERAVRVHLHTANPGRALEYGLQHGELDQITIDNINRQARDLDATRRQPASSLPLNLPPVGKQAVLAVASGEGLIRALLDMGATGIIPGGLTMNPSIEELLTAVHDAPVHDVILLPNNPNLLLAAQQVAQLADKHVRVVPTRSFPQAIAALTAFNANAELERNVAAMTEALSAVRTVEVTRADKDVTLDGVSARKGDAIALVDDRLVASEADERSAIFKALPHCDPEQAELITIFAGAGATVAETQVLASAIKDSYPWVEVQVHPGGQPHYLYIISVE